MKRYMLLMCASLLVRGGWGQDMSGPASAPVRNDIVASPGKCAVVRPGDIVHFELTIQSVEYAKAVFADLQLRRGHGESMHGSDLPLPDFHDLGGGGLATRDARVGNLYHFAFRVRPDVLSGIYRGSGVSVTLNDDGDPAGRTRDVDVTSHTRKQIRNYCLTVVSPLWGDGRPLVTNFKGGPVEHPGK